MKIVDVLEEVICQEAANAGMRAGRHSYVIDVPDSLVPSEVLKAYNNRYSDDIMSFPDYTIANIFITNPDKNKYDKTRDA